MDEKWLVEDTVEIAIQVNGKLRARLEVPIDIDEESLRQQVLAEERVREYTEGKDIITFVHVPGRMVNMVVR